MIVGKSIRIVFDKKMLDPDGNLLAYVEIKTGPEVWMTVNKRIIAAGYVGYREDPLNRAYAESLEFLQLAAKEKKAGIWKE
jgi:endonuclease YncB( thermonuclease family)